MLIRYVCLAAGLLLLMPICFFIFKRNIDRTARFCAVEAAALYFAFVIAITLSENGTSRGSVNLIPFSGILIHTDSGSFFHKEYFLNYLAQSGANLLLLFPIGIMLQFFGEVRGTMRQAILALAIGGAVSVVIEFLQFVLPIGRVFDVDDIILNATGSFLGSFFGMLLLKIPLLYEFRRDILHCGGESYESLCHQRFTSIDRLR